MAHRGHRGGKVIDQLVWCGWGFSFPALSAGTSAQTFFAAQASPQTIMRTRGQLAAYMDTTLAPGIQVEIAVGIIIVPEGSGTTAAWDPIDDTNAPWMYYSRFMLGYEEYVTDVIDCPGITSYRETIDVKAMRKMKTDTEAQIVVRNATVLSAGAINLTATGRVLIGHR